MLILVMISVILLILIISLSFLIILLNMKGLLNWISDICDECRMFIEKNRGFFTIFFILVFLFEQILFILLISLLFDISKWASAGIGIFALIVVTTASFQKFIWEYKFQRAQQKVKLVIQKNKFYFIKFKELIHENILLMGENERLKKRLEEKG